MSKLNLMLISSAMILALSVSSLAQTFGKNKVNYTEYNWLYIQTEHFDIYFAEGSLWIAEFTAKAAEDALALLEEDLNYSLQRRIPIIVYNSHNSFSETNVIFELLGEGVGGFTELAKNRVVIPYEGSYEKLRHVIHHELTHAVTFEMLTDGGGLQAMLSGQAVQPPLWVAEGLAEYESLGWDVKTEDIMRDATISDYLPPIKDISGGIFAYKGGQSIFRFIAQEYGGDKVGEVLSSLKASRTLDKAMRTSIGVGVEELNEAWSRSLKKQYWPEIALRKEPGEVAKRLTDHREEGAFLNIGPTFSPQSDKIAFVSNRRGYADIYLMSVIDGLILNLLVEGEQTESFESLLLLRPGISWSPDGREIAFIAKSGDKNALYILDVRRKHIRKKLKFDLDGMFTPSWSPKGDRIVVVGLKDGWSDLYLVDLSDDSLHRLTNDPYDEEDPEWSPDGSKIAFSSDRPDETLSFSETEDFEYGQYDIFVLQAEGSHITRITSDESADFSPTWSPDSRKIAFVSERTGIGNIFVADLDSSSIYPMTDLLTSCQDLDWSDDGRKIAFSSFHKGGYDIYVLSNPLSHRRKLGDIQVTSFMKEKAAAPVVRKTLIDSMLISAGEKRTGDLSGRKLKVNEYKLKFSPEFFAANAGFSTFYGFSGLAQLSLSDVLGNHRFFFVSDLNFSVKNSDFLLSYLYLPKRTDYGVSFFHTRSFFLLSSGAVAADRMYGLSAFASRPFSKFTRLELGAIALALDREILRLRRSPFDGLRGGFFGETTRGLSGEPTESRKALVVGLSLVNDTVLHGHFAPIDGSRSIVALQYSPGGLSFTTISADYRRYFHILKNYNFVIRLAGGTSFGREAPRFFLGGVRNEINPRFADSSERDLEPGDILFSSFETPLRGTDLFELVGDSFVLVNMEFRFPFVRQLALGWPLPLFLRDVGGVLFLDFGGAFDRERFKPIEKRDGTPRLRDLVGGYGFGMRMDVGVFILRFDTAWRTDLQEVFPPKYYFSVGMDF